MLVRVGCSFVHVATTPTHAVLQVEPRRDVGGTVVEERWDNDPPAAGTTYVDLYGNLCRRLSIPDGRSSLSYDALHGGRRLARSRTRGCTGGCRR